MYTYIQVYEVYTIIYLYILQYTSIMILIQGVRIPDDGGIMTRTRTKIAYTFWNLAPPPGPVQPLNSVYTSCMESSYWYIPSCMI